MPPVNVRLMPAPPRRTSYGLLGLLYGLMAIGLVVLGLLDLNGSDIAGWFALAGGVGLGLFSLIFVIAWRRRRL